MKLIQKHTINKNSNRGTFAVSRKLNSGINYITVSDYKSVSIISTATVVTPKSKMGRTIVASDEKKKTDIDFPFDFAMYNKDMGGNVLHEQHCSDFGITISGKKWTWAMFCRIIQSSLTNAMVLHNLVDEKYLSAKDFALSIQRDYLLKKSKEELAKHARLKYQGYVKLVIYVQFALIFIAIIVNYILVFFVLELIMDYIKVLKSLLNKICTSSHHFEKKIVY